VSGHGLVIGLAVVAVAVILVTLARVLRGKR
jgi:hypothetical protein